MNMSVFAFAWLHKFVCACLDHKAVKPHGKTIYQCFLATFFLHRPMPRIQNNKKKVILPFSGEPSSHRWPCVCCITLQKF